MNPGRAAGAAAVLFAAAASLRAQLVPITRCNAAIPCNIPIGLRPADAAAWTPGNNIGRGNTGLSVSTGIDKGLEPKIDKPPVSDDFSEAAARMYVRKNPIAASTAPKAGSPGPTAKPTPAPTPPQPPKADPRQ